MKPITVIFFIITIIVIIGVNDSEGIKFFKFLKRIKKVGKVGKVVGKIGNHVSKGIKKVAKGVGSGVKKVAKKIKQGIEKGKNLVKKIIKKPVSKIKYLPYPIIELLIRRKKVKVEIDENPVDPKENAPASEPFDTKLLRLHNELRTEAKSGQALKWDNLLQAAAEKWAGECRNGYKTFGDSRDDTYGQNIYPVREDDAHPYNAVVMWKSFRESYKEGSFECLDNQDCYPYLQMIWPSSKYIGCAVSKCPLIKDISAAGSVLVCFYTPV